MITENHNSVSALLDAGAAHVEARDFGENGIPFIVAPDNYTDFNLEKYLPVPVRKRGAIVTLDSNGFIDYLNKHADKDASTIYANVDSEKSHCCLVCVIDDHGKDDAKWRDHTCEFKPKLAVEWTRWLGKNKQVMSQSDFAAWLEDNLTDIATMAGMPSGADILAMALGFEATYDKRLKSKMNLQSGGVQFEFVEDEHKDTRTTMKVFERFTIGVPVFDGSVSAYPIEARIKYRTKNDGLTFWYELIRPDRAFKTAVMEELENVKVRTGLQIISGHAGL